MILRPNSLVQLKSDDDYTLIGVLLKQTPKSDWWMIGVVYSDHPNYPAGGWDLSVHQDLMEPLAVEFNGRLILKGTL